jgi:hypothetical protein
MIEITSALQHLVCEIKEEVHHGNFSRPPCAKHVGSQRPTSRIGTRTMSVSHDDQMDRSDGHLVSVG